MEGMTNGTEHWLEDEDAWRKRWGLPSREESLAKDPVWSRGAVTEASRTAQGAEEDDNPFAWDDEEEVDEGNGGREEEREERPARRERRRPEPPKEPQEEKEPNPFLFGEMSTTEMIALAGRVAPQAVERLWFGVYPAGVTLLNGETGAGKTSLLYNVAVHAALDKALWGITFGLARAARVYYLDPENAGRFTGQPKTTGLCYEKIARIGEENPPCLVFHDGQRVNLTKEEHAHWLTERLKQGHGGQPFDLLVIDPVAALFAVKDENDNAAMQRVMDTLRLIARRTGAAVIACHHTGKTAMYGGGNGVMSGRGASSMPGGADVVMTWRVRGEDEEEHEGDFDGKPKERSGVCRLRIEKDRMGAFGKGASLYLKMAGNDRFERVSATDWKTRRTSESGPSSLEAAREWVKTKLQEEPMSRKELEALRMVENPGFGVRFLDEAIAALAQDDSIRVKETRARNEKVYAFYDPFADDEE